MQEIRTENDLNAAILGLETKRKEEERELKDQFKIAVDSIRPINIIKRSIKDAMESPQLKDDIINSALGFASGYISKKLFVGFSGGPIKKLVGSAIMMGVTQLVTNHPEMVKSIGKSLWEIFGNKKKEEV